MSNVFVLDTQKQPLNPVHPGRARLLLTQGKAAVYRRYPFTIILKTVIEQPDLQPLRLKIDPGSQTTGLTLINDASSEVVWAAEMSHRGQTLKKSLDNRRAIRRSRRARKTRYRVPRFDNLTRRPGWLPPSLESRIANVETWGKRLMQLCPVTAISQELVKFDMQQMEHPEISGKEYQQGTLAGYELREYVLYKWNRACSYCGAKNVPLELEHIRARANGGSNRVSNLCLACHPCNEQKGTQDIRDFLAHKPTLAASILATSRSSLKDVAAVNATRWLLYARLKALGVPVETGTGGRTKWNRTLRGLPKEHWIDAACVGESTPRILTITGVVPLIITATGHGSRRVCNVDRFGFPRGKAKGAKRVKGFQTGDLVRAVVPSGKKKGTYVGRVLVRVSGSFDIRTAQGRVQGISSRFCTPIHRADGYSYQTAGAHGHDTPPLPPEKERAILPLAQAQGHPDAVSVKSSKILNRKHENCEC